MITPDLKICPRCGEPVAEQRFCGSCGLNLGRENDLPMRVGGEANRVKPSSETVGAGSEPQAAMEVRDEVKARPENPTATLLGFRDWFREQRREVQGAVVAIAAIVLILIVVAANSGGGSNSAISGQDPTHCDSLCGDSAFGVPSKWPNGSATTVTCSDVNAGIEQFNFVAESWSAATDYCARHPNAAVNIELQGQ
jgi:hypothetical protein